MPGRIYRRRWTQVVFWILSAFVFILGWWWEDRILPQSGWQRTQGQLVTGEYVVSRVIDGDTLVLQQQGLRVRLQGIDTPETVQKNKPVEAWGPEASEYTSQFLDAANWRVRLEIDGEPVDRYGRHLAFVWHEERLLNEELVRYGFAHAKTNYDFSRSMKQRLRQAQVDAQQNQRGLWSGL